MGRAAYPICPAVLVPWNPLATRGRAMRITQARTDHYAIPLPTVLSDSTHGDMSTFGLITVRLRDDEGCEGLGYTYTVGDIGGAAVRSVAERDLAPVIEGADPRRVEALWERMWWRMHFIGRGGLVAFAMAAVDTALWDLNARRTGEPLWRFLGGHDDRVHAYAGGIDLQFTTEALLDQARGFLDGGFRAIKMKVGRDRLGEDVERVAAMRELLGSEFPLLVDANMRWSVSEAIRAARALAPHDVYWLEEPTADRGCPGGKPSRCAPAHLHLRNDRRSQGRRDGQRPLRRDVRPRPKRLRVPRR